MHRKTWPQLSFGSSMFLIIVQPLAAAFVPRALTSFRFYGACSATGLFVMLRLLGALLGMGGIEPPHRPCQAGATHGHPCCNLRSACSRVAPLGGCHNSLVNVLGAELGLLHPAWLHRRPSHRGPTLSRTSTSANTSFARFVLGGGHNYTPLVC